MGNVDSTPSGEHRAADPHVTPVPPGTTQPKFGANLAELGALHTDPTGQASRNPSASRGAREAARGSAASLADMLIDAINRDSGGIPEPLPDRSAEVKVTPSTVSVPSLPDDYDRADTFVFDKPADRVLESEVEPAELIGSRYRVVRKLSHGGMARIFKVEHASLGKPFALKVMYKNLSSDPQLRQMFFREAKVTSSLNHPNIVAVTDFGVDRRIGAYIVMEYLSGQTLHQRLREAHRLPISAAMDVMMQTAQALHYMHGQNFIHCDVKSENIFLCQQPEGERNRQLVKLIDFGLSKAEAFHTKLARSEVGGTPEYIAPEQVRGLAPQPSMDIYSLGVLFFEMLTGRPPFLGKPNELIRHHLSTPPPSPSEVLGEPLDEQVERLVLQLLAKDPAERPATMGQLIYHLRTLADMLGLRSARGRRNRTGNLPVTPSREDRNLRAIFQHCPCPLFRVDVDGTLVAANYAFRHFVRASGSEIIGSPLEQTRLRYIFPDVADRLLEAATTGESVPVVRSTTFNRVTSPVTVKIMLVPERNEQGAVQHFTGIIHSLSDE